jgi:limonene 1,2-monooxygenase
MFGVGPGALPSDAAMLGIAPDRQRAMMAEALEAILALLTTDEPVTYETDWFVLRDARLQLRPYQHPCFEVAVAAMVSPAGPRLAGRFGTGLLSFGATSMGGFDALGTHWGVLESQAARFNTVADRRRWRLAAPVHVAESVAQARRDVEFGLADWVRYFREVAALPLAPDVDDSRDIVDAMNASGFAVIGTPDMVVAQVQRLADASGGFGTFLVMAHEWADREATLRSFELVARDVMPLFQGSATRAVKARDWAAENRPSFVRTAGAAVMKAVQDHYAESSAPEAPARD